VTAARCAQSSVRTSVLHENLLQGVTESVSTHNLRRDSVKISICKECKGTIARHAQSPARS
jgi:hypothetical protein